MANDSIFVEAKHDQTTTLFNKRADLLIISLQSNYVTAQNGYFFMKGILK